MISLNFEKEPKKKNGHLEGGPNFWGGKKKEELMLDVVFSLR